jgi:methionyl-tRNA formyltransferase
MTIQSEPAYIVLGSRPWNRRVFDEKLSGLAGRWSFMSGPDELTGSAVAAIAPRYLFFLHWSSKVPRELYEQYECVAFHMTDLPFGRGGSPLQNLIMRGHITTKLTAFRMTGELDAGPVYGQAPLSLNGRAEEIYIRATEISAEMIARIVLEQPEPIPQRGEAVCFVRRTPEQSRIEPFESVDALYDHIRMLDANGYPPAFLDHAGFRFEFRRAARHDGRIETDVVITPLPNRS